MDFEETEEDSFNIPSKTDLIINEDGSITADEITIPPAPKPALTVEATKERLVITDLIVRDFKSYAGTHTIGPFNKNFSCIVGPNGSGKSNVIDSLLFVFGYRAQKIRSKKVSVLIHKSHKYPDLQSCSVEVNFAMIKDEGKSFTVIPNSKFSVKRTGYNDNTSTYEINGRRAQYKDVASTLKSYGIDLEYNRFMILQGEIELISMMKPKAPTEQDSGMLEYIEDIIGSNRFIKPIQLFNEKCEKMNEIRLEKLNELKVIEKERADYEKPRNKALEYLRLANKVTLLKNSALQAQLHGAVEDEKKISDSKNLLAEMIETSTAKMEEIQIAKDLKQNEMNDLMSEYEHRLKIVEDFKTQFTELERQDVACRENIKNSKEKLKKFAKNLESEEAKIPNLKKKLQTVEGEIKELEIKKEKALKAKSVEEEKLNEVMESLKEEIKEFQEEKDEYEEQLIKLKSVVDEKNSENSFGSSLPGSKAFRSKRLSKRFSSEVQTLHLNLAENELELLLSAEKKEKDAFEKLKAEYEKTLSLLEEEKKLMKENEEKLPELEKELTSCRKKYTDAERKEGSNSEEIKSKRIKLDELQSSLSASQSRSTLVKAFLEQKEKGKLTGVLGRLGDLGAIDGKYDVAISTACGALDNIVTDTITTAQECVDFLKANELGYATFIALDKMEKWIPYTQKKIDTPENVPRLFDLITVKNEAVLPAFYFALRDTLVAKDLDQATRVGLQGAKRYRVVTLKGELIDLSGTMSGGGGKVMKGRMGQTVTEDTSFSKKDIQQLTQDLETLTQEVISIKKLKEELKEKINNIEREIPRLQHSLKKAKSNCNAYAESEKLIASQMEDQKKRIKSAAPEKNKIKEIELKIEEKRKRHSKAVNEAAAVEEKVKSLQEKILAVTKGKIGAAQKKVDKLTKEVDSVNDALVKSKNLVKKTTKDLQKAEEKLMLLQEDIEGCKASKEDLAKEFEELGKKGIEITEKKNAAEKELETFEVKKKALSKEVHEFSSQVQEMKSAVIELKNKLKLIDLDLKARKGLTQSLKSQLAKLEIYEVDDEPTDLPTLPAEELLEVNIDSAYLEAGRIEGQMKNMDPDLSAIAEFKRKDEMYKAKQKDLEKTIAERDHYKQHHDRLRKCRMDEFMKGFTIVSLKVKELYQMITLGGDAELELVDSLDPFSEGIEFSVRPLRKSWKSIRNLSGGEKTLSSLSLVFALHYYRSTPFFVMDEIDAALDFRNVSIIGCYIKECTKNAQFIVISLRENMFQRADHLVGIYKTNNRTKNVHLSPSLLAKFEKLEKSLRSSLKNGDKEKEVQSKVTEQQNIHESKDTVQNSDISENSEIKGEKTPDEAKNQSNKRTVTFSVDPKSKRRKSDTFDLISRGNESAISDLSSGENKENEGTTLDLSSGASKEKKSVIFNFE